jgi:hypothetical protein
MKELYVLISILLLQSVAFSQTVSLPIDFESGSVILSDFSNFDGGTASVIANPAPTAFNTSATVGQMVRNGGQVWAGAYLTTTSNVDFSVNPIICMNVYSMAPVGTQISLKMEGCGGGCSRELDAFTTVTGEWETLCYDFTGEPTIYNRLVFLFDLGNVGNGTSSSTFLFDDIEQLPTLPLFLTPGSQYFCPTGSLTLTFPGSGSYNWYSDAGGTTLIQAGSSTYTTPILSGDASYYVRDMTPSTFPAIDVGPSSRGASDPESGPASVFFTSNVDNGFWYSADIVEKIVGGGPPPYTCQYTVTGLNLTQATSQSLTWNHVGASDNAQWTYNFPAPVPMDLNDNMELRVTVSGDPGCYISSHHSGGDVITSFPTASSGGHLLFTGHTPNPNTWMGFDYRISGDFVDPTLYQVNAIDDCGIPLPVELLSFSVKEDEGTALLTWSTASEINNDRFEVMRSVDGIEYKTIGRVFGAGNSSSLLRYAYLDTYPEMGLSYYQLKQIDFDGTEDLSWPVAFVLGNSSEFNLFPNPTTQDLKILLGESYKMVEVRIFNVDGGLVDKQAFQSTELLNIQLNGRPGVYMVEIMTDRGKNAIFNVMKK